MLYMLAFIFFLALLRLFERALGRGQTPFDPADKITDHRRHYDRQDRTVAKDLTRREYDPVARERLQDRRRKLNPDSGERRRKNDQ